VFFLEFVGSFLQAASSSSSFGGLQKKMVDVYLDASQLSLSDHIVIPS
jgi:hypothetical protein